MDWRLKQIQAVGKTLSEAFESLKCLYRLGAVDDLAELRRSELAHTELLQAVNDYFSGGSANLKTLLRHKQLAFNDATNDLREAYVPITAELDRRGTSDANRCYADAAARLVTSVVALSHTLQGFIDFAAGGSLTLTPEWQAHQAAAA